MGGQLLQALAHRALCRNKKYFCVIRTCIEDVCKLTNLFKIVARQTSKIGRLRLAFLCNPHVLSR